MARTKAQWWSLPNQAKVLIISGIKICRMFLTFLGWTIMEILTAHVTQQTTLSSSWMKVTSGRLLYSMLLAKRPTSLKFHKIFDSYLGKSQATLISQSALPALHVKWIQLYLQQKQAHLVWNAPGRIKPSCKRSILTGRRLRTAPHLRESRGAQCNQPASFLGFFLWSFRP